MAKPIKGTNRSDYLEGTFGNDTIDGLGGDDFLVDFFGDDLLNGGPGNDQLYDQFGDDSLNGGSGNDWLYDEFGDDILNGGPGDDTLDSSRGNDRLNGGPGIDTASINFFYDANAGVSFALDNGPVVTASGTKVLSSIEAVSVIGTPFDDTFTGGANADFLYGQDGDDVLNGQSGDDTLDGATGNDLLNGGTGIDSTTLNFNGAASGVSYTLDEGSVVTPIGTKVLTSIEAVTIYGSSFDDTLSGGEYGDFIVANEGSDRLNGGDGNDLLLGEDGDDTIYGGPGADQLGGSSDSDTFAYRTTEDSEVSSGSDTIFDFVSGDDKVDLSAIDADSNVEGNQAFLFIGDSAFNNVAGELRAFIGTDGFTTYVQADVNGDGVADLEIRIGQPVSLQLVDFVL
jgi:serralysin